MEASGDTDVQINSSAKRPKTNRPILHFIPSTVSLRQAGAKQLSTCNANDPRNRQRVVLDLLCRTSNGKDQVVSVGEPLAHARTLLFSLPPLPHSPLPSSSRSHAPCVDSTRHRAYIHCVAAKGPHVLDMWTCFWYTRRRSERTHGGVVNLHVFFFQCATPHTPHTTHAPLLPPPTHSNTAQYNTEHVTEKQREDEREDEREEEREDEREDDKEKRGDEERQR